MSKFRKSFVTNSSSSSFICEVSGHVEAGYDLCMSDAGFYECENDHMFCKDYLVGELGTMDKEEMLEYLSNKKDEWEKFSSKYYNSQVKDVVEEIQKLVSLTDADEVKEFIEELIESYELDGNYGIPAHNCPICTLTHITDSAVMNAMFTKYGVTRAEIETEIREKAKK